MPHDHVRLILHKPTETVQQHPKDESSIARYLPPLKIPISDPRRDTSCALTGGGHIYPVGRLPPLTMYHCICDMILIIGSSASELYDVVICVWFLTSIEAAVAGKKTRHLNISQQTLAC